jgi:hypothetical protein
MSTKPLYEDPSMRVTALPGRIYVIDVFHNLSLGGVTTALDAIWASPGWRQPWGLVIVMHDSATYDSDIRKHAVPPDHKRAVGTAIVTTKPMQRMVIKSIGLGLGLVARFVLTAEGTVDAAVTAQLELIRRAEQQKLPYG